MAKATRGGKRVTIQIPVTPPVTPPTPPTPAPAEPEEEPITAAEFDKMTVDEKIDAVEQAIKKDVPDFFNDNSYERFTYNIEGVDGKPTVVDENTLDGMKGRELFRTVHGVYDRKNDVNYTAKQIYNQVARGTNTRASNDGGSAYGRGLYFAGTYNASVVYMSYSTNDNLVMRAKITSGKGCDYYTAYNAVKQEMAKGTKMGRLLSKCDNDSRTSIWARINGYSYLREGNYNKGEYHVILDRRCLSLSSKTAKPSGGGW